MLMCECENTNDKYIHIYIYIYIDIIFYIIFSEWDADSEVDELVH